MADAPVKKSLMVFIDGFNLYYGLLKANPRLKWLNLRKMVETIYPGCDILNIKYFTAYVDDGLTNPTSKRLRQINYCKALGSVGVEIVTGRLEPRDRMCGVALCNHIGDRRFRSYTEKMTDVNMALAIYKDTFNSRPDKILVISGDTDILPALREVRALYKCSRQVLIPCTEEQFLYRRVDEFGQNGWRVKNLTEEVIERSQFADSVVISPEESVVRPIEWR